MLHTVVDPQKELVQAIDIKVHAVDTNVVNIRNTLRSLTEGKLVCASITAEGTQ